MSEHVGEVNLPGLTKVMPLVGVPGTDAGAAVSEVPLRAGLGACLAGGVNM